MKIMEFLEILVQIVFILLILLGFYMLFIADIIFRHGNKDSIYGYKVLIIALFIAFLMVIYYRVAEDHMTWRYRSYGIDKFPTRILGTAWGRALYATTVVTSCILISIGSVILLVNGIPREKLEENYLNTPITAPKIESPDTASTSTLPPILSIEKIRFSQKVLDADETAMLSIHIKNVGRGDARDLTIHLKSNFQGLSFPQITPVPSIRKKTGQQTVDIHVKGTADLSNGKAKIEIYLEEPHFEQRIPGKQLTFDTRKPRTPDLVLADYAVVEKVSASPNNRIDVNEEIALKFYVQNKGTGTAEKVTVQVKNNQTGVTWLPEANETGYRTTTATFSQIAPGKHELISYIYHVNSKFTDKELRFTISATEKLKKKYGFSEIKKIAINKKLKPLGEITPISIDPEAPLHENPRVEELPPLKSSGNTLWIFLLSGIVLIVICFVSFIIWKRRRKGKQTKPDDSDPRQKAAYKAATGRKERFK